MFIIDWKLAIDISQIIATIVLIFTLGITANTFYWGRKANQISIAEGIFKELREMQKELKNIKEDDELNLTDWDSRFFNTLEWFSFLVNVNNIKDKKIKEFFKDGIIQWYEELLPEEDKINDKKFPELKKLYKKFKKGLGKT